MHYVMVGDQVILASEVKEPVNKGLEHVIGKSTPNDRRFIPKVDPTLVTERINGELQTHKPILTYTGVLQRKPGFWETASGIFISGLIGGGFVGCLYYWQGIELFAK